MQDDAYAYRREERKGALEQLGADALAWLRARTSDQWLMFTAGLALGILIG